MQINMKFLKNPSELIKFVQTDELRETIKMLIGSSYLACKFSWDI